MVASVAHMVVAVPHIRTALMDVAAPLAHLDASLAQMLASFAHIMASSAHIAASLAQMTASFDCKTAKLLMACISLTLTFFGFLKFSADCLCSFSLRESFAICPLSVYISPGLAGATICASAQHG